MLVFINWFQGGEMGSSQWLSTKPLANKNFINLLPDTGRSMAGLQAGFSLALIHQFPDQAGKLL